MDDDFVFDNRLTFEAYLYDYLKKKNMHETAEIFKKEANLDLGSDFRPAIDIPGGFLQEWWSIFSDHYNSQQQGDNHPRQGSSTTVTGHTARGKKIAEAMQQANASRLNKINLQQRTNASLLNAQRTNASLLNAQRTNALNRTSRNQNTAGQLAREASGPIMKGKKVMGSMMRPPIESQRYGFFSLPSSQQEALKASSLKSTSSSIPMGISVKSMGQEAASSVPTALGINPVTANMSGRGIMNQSNLQGPGSSRLGAPSVSETSETSPPPTDTDEGSASSHTKDDKMEKK